MVDGAPTEEIGLARVVSVRPALLSRQNRSVGRSNNTRLGWNEALVVFLIEKSMSLENQALHNDFFNFLDYI